MKRPNILLLVADQLRYDCMGFAGKYPVKTPHLDRLASEGACFDNAFTPHPVCAPARQCMLSGRAADSFGALWNYDFLETKTLQPTGSYWTDRLRQNGYRTAFVGKWHSSATHPPSEFGFGDYISFAGHSELMKQRYPDVNYTGGWFGERNPVPVQDSKTHWIADQACRLMDEYVKSGEPWHIRLDITDPHLPCRPSEPFAGMYSPADAVRWDGFDDTFENKPYIQRQQPVTWGLDHLGWEEWSECVARYYAMISQVDDAMGKILDALEHSGAAEDTLVIFTSDHGDMCGSHHMIDKHYILYDDVLHVPLILRYPGVIPAGLRAADFVSNCLDLAPTVEEACSLPADGIRHGLSLLAPAKGRPQERKPFAVASGNGQQFGLYSQRAIRTTNRKYIWNLTDTDELYDLDADPGELVNKISDPDFAEELTELRRLLYAELIAREDPFAKTGWLDRQMLEGKKL